MKHKHTIPVRQRAAVAERSRKQWTLHIVCVSTALLVLNFAAPQVALPAIAEGLDAGFSDLQWVLSVFPLAVAVFLLAAGSLADRFGRRRLFVIGLSMFSVASLLCAAASNPTGLVLARLVQGVGAAIIFPSSLALLADEFHGGERRRAIGIWGAVIGLAFAAGPLVGGVLVDTLGWRSVFASNVILGVPTIALALRHLRESRDPDPPPLDWAGVSTLCTGLFLVFFAALKGNDLGWTGPTVIAALGGGGTALAIFVAVERSKPRPMLEIGLFRNRTFTGATLVVCLMAAGTFGPVVYLTLFLLEVQGRAPVETGLVLAPLAIVSFGVAALAGRANERLPLRGALVAGMLVAAGGVLLLRAGLSATATWAALATGLAAIGAAIGLVNPLVTFAHLGVLPPSQGGLASAVNNAARQLGHALGIAVLGAFLPTAARAGVAQSGADTAAFTAGVDELLLVAAGLNLLAAVAAAGLIRQGDLWNSPLTPAAPPGTLASSAATALSPAGASGSAQPLCSGSGAICSGTPRKECLDRRESPDIAGRSARSHHAWHYLPARTEASPPAPSPGS